MCKTSSERSARRLLGLEEVLLHLEYKKFADFTYLMDSYQARSGIDLGNIDSAARLRFQEILLASTGLPVMILFMAAKPQWVVLKEAQSSHLVSLFSSILSAHKPPDPDPSIRRSIDTVLRTMSTEYDRCCARAVLFLGMPDAIQTLGFNYEKMEREQVTVFGVAVTLNELESVAKTDVISSQTKRIKDLAAKIDNKRISLKVRRYKLDAATIAEEEEVIEMLRHRLSNLRNLNHVTDSDAQRKLKRRVAYRLKVLRESSRVTSTRKSWVHPKKISPAIELAIAKAIADKSTFHGRRHDSVLYTNHRVLTTDLVKIANFSILQAGGAEKDLVRSVSTPCTFMKPVNKRSIQGSGSCATHSGSTLYDLDFN